MTIAVCVRRLAATGAITPIATLGPPTGRVGKTLGKGGGEDP
jgi:hypothetical protein